MTEKKKPVKSGESGYEETKKERLGRREISDAGKNRHRRGVGEKKPEPVKCVEFHERETRWGLCPGKETFRSNRKIRGGISNGQVL